MKLTGIEAIEYTTDAGLLLSKYADPTEDVTTGLTPEEARRIAQEDVNLIWIETVPYMYDLWVGERWVCGSGSLSRIVEDHARQSAWDGEDWKLTARLTERDKPSLDVIVLDSEHYNPGPRADGLSRLSW
mgnify:FL=1